MQPVDAEDWLVTQGVLVPSLEGQNKIYLISF